jgi:hypothetical protein
MQLINAQGKPVQTGDILHGKRGRYIFLGHDGKLINIQTADERRVYSWIDPSRLGLHFVSTQPEAS